MPPGLRRDEALYRIGGLDYANPAPTRASCDPSLPLPPEAAAWRQTLEDARVDYRNALAGVLKRLVCSDVEDAGDVLRGLLRNSIGMELTESRLEATGAERQALVDAIKACRSPSR